MYKFQNHFSGEYFNQQNIQLTPTSKAQLCTHIINISTKLDFFPQLSRGCAQVLSRKIVPESFGHVAQTTEWTFSHFDDEKS